MIRESAILCTVALCLTCSAAEWNLHDVIRLQEDQLALSDAQKEVLHTIEDAYTYAIDALDRSRKALEEASAQARKANAVAISDALTRDQQDTLDTVFRESREVASKERLAKDVDHLTRLLPILKKLKAIKSFTILEGLERKAMDLPKPPPNGPPMVQVGTHFFFEQPLELDGDRQLLVKETVSNYRSFLAYDGGKFCGGFHPDANVRIDTDQGVIQMLVCFGCAEIRIVDGADELMVEIEKEAYWTLETICRRSFRHRANGVIPAAFPVDKKAEPDVGADSR